MSDLPAEPDYPYPPRFWWLKRIVAASVLFIAFFAGLMWWWSYEADRRMAAEIAAIRARGEPALYEDFDVPPVPDEDNAALSLESAARAISLTKPQSDFVDLF